MLRDGSFTYNREFLLWDFSYEALNLTKGLNENIFCS